MSSFPRVDDSMNKADIVSFVEENADEIPELADVSTSQNKAPLIEAVNDALEAAEVREDKAVVDEEDSEDEVAEKADAEEAVAEEAVAEKADAEEAVAEEAVAEKADAEEADAKEADAEKAEASSDVKPLRTASRGSDFSRVSRRRVDSVRRRR
jgi:uncharacterized protein YjbI with pentapeptide repeats